MTANVTPLQNAESVAEAPNLTSGVSFGTRATLSAEDDRPWPVYFGREMRGGLRGGHQHISYSSTPVLKRKGTWYDCPACVEWAKELAQIDGNTSPLMEVSPNPQQNDGLVSGANE